MHSYLSYAKLAWGSHLKKKCSTLYRKKKYSIRLLSFKVQLTHSRLLFKEIGVLNLYEIIKPCLTYYSLARYCFSITLRGYRKATSACNGLIEIHSTPLFIFKLFPQIYTENLYRKVP